MGHGQASLVFCTRSFGRTATRTTIIGCPDGSTVKCEVVRWRWHDDARQAQFSQILIFTSLCFFFDWEFERFLHHVLHGRISWARKQRENIHQEFSEMRLFLYHNKWSQCCFIVSLISCTYHCDTSLVMIYNYLICDTAGFGNVTTPKGEVSLRLPIHMISVRTLLLRQRRQRWSEQQCVRHRSTKWSNEKLVNPPIPTHRCVSMALQVSLRIEWNGLECMDITKILLASLMSHRHFDLSI